MTDRFHELHRPAPKNLEGGHASDNFQTPWHALPMIARYISKDLPIWEPACGEGNIVRFFQKAGYSVNGTDYLMGEKYNFFYYHNPFPWRVLVTNPPWSLKIEFTERCLALNRPFALLVPLTYLEGGGTQLVDENDIRILKPYWRINYKTPHEGWYGCYNKEADCKYSQKEYMDACPMCGNTKIRIIKSAAQKQSMWITWGLDLKEKIVYYDNSEDIKTYGYSG